MSSKQSVSGPDYRVRKLDIRIRSNVYSKDDDIKRSSVFKLSGSYHPEIENARIKCLVARVARRA